MNALRIPESEQDHYLSPARKIATPQAIISKKLITLISVRKILLKRANIKRTRDVIQNVQKG